MIDKQEIIKRMQKIDLNDNAIQAAFSDVEELILQKVVMRHLMRLPETEQEKIKKFSKDELLEYVRESSKTEPFFSDQEFGEVYDATWQDYFRAMAE